jgi:hypothetical protein
VHVPPTYGLTRKGRGFGEIIREGAGVSIVDLRKAAVHAGVVS